MSVWIAVWDGEDEQLFDVESDPISIGGEGATLEFRDAPDSAVIALIGASGGRPFIQRTATSGPNSVFWNEQAVETSRWLDATGQLRIGSLRIGFEPRGEKWRLRVERIGEVDHANLTGRQPIELIPYHLAEKPEAEGPRPRRRGLLIFATGALLVAALAAAFVSATSSVGIVLIPEADRVSLEGEASIRIGGRWLLRPGRYVIHADKEGYEPFVQPIDVLAETDPNFSFSLRPLPGLLSITTEPVSSASVWIDDVEVGRTPIDRWSLPGGTYRLRVTAPLHRSIEETLEVEGFGREQNLTLQLIPAWAKLTIESEPSGAELFVDGRSAGTTPLILQASEGQRTLAIALAGYLDWNDSIEVVAEQAQTIGPIRLAPTPKKRPDAPPPRNGTHAARAPQEGPAPRPKPAGVAHPLKLKPEGASELLLLEGGAVTLGTPRGQQGRRSNELQRNVELSRPFYLATREITNQDFRAFRKDHDSGSVRTHSLRGNNHPVVRIDWQDAAAYCNWLSKREGLPPAYVQQNGQLVSAIPLTTGYRLPTEAEWSFAAKTGSGKEQTGRYPWGTGFPPPGGAANLGDHSASALLNTHLQSFNDGFAVSAPVGSYSANELGFFDLAGNVSEWVNDYYSANGDSGNDPTGPKTGRRHVVRGSSFRHSSITQLRTAYRDSAQKPRDDLGFRIARYAE